MVLKNHARNFKASATALKKDKAVCRKVYIPLCRKVRMLFPGTAHAFSKRGAYFLPQRCVLFKAGTPPVPYMF